ncbi:hypothetical protein ACWB3E_02235 [Acinetobacter baumannii]
MLPDKSELIDPDVTESQFKDALARLVDSVSDTDYVEQKANDAEASAKTYADQLAVNTEEKANTYTDEKTFYLEVLNDGNGFRIKDELGRIAAILNKYGKLTTTSSETYALNVVSKGNSDNIFEVVDEIGRIAFAIRKDGRILPDFRSLSQSYGPYVLKPDATVDDINQALQQFKIVSLSPRSQLVIDKPIKIPNFGVLDFALSDIFLAANANCYILQNDDLFAGADLIVAKNGRLHGRGSSQVRNANGDFRTGYYGFGCAFSGVKDLQMENFYIEDTNGWGVAYLRCGTVNFKKFKFSQNEKLSGGNGDGITGQAKRIFIDGVEGFTNDDMIAVTSGKGTLRSIDIGVSNEECFDIEIVEIKNIHGEVKNGVATYTGIGLYPTAGKTMRNVTIKGVTGEFDVHAWQATNYWPANGQAFIDNLTVENITAKARVNNARVTYLDNIEHLTIEGVTNDSQATSKATVLVDQSSKISNLTIRNAKNKTTDVLGSASIVYVTNQSKSFGLRKVVVENSEIVKVDDLQKNALITAIWTSDAEPIDVSLLNVNVDRATGDLKASDVLSSTNEALSKYRYSGAQKLYESLTLVSGWTGTASVIAQVNSASLSGLIQAPSFTNNTLITTLPKLMRPTSLKKYRLSAVEGDFNFIDIMVNEAGEVRLIDSHASNTSNVFDLSNIEFLI